MGVGAFLGLVMVKVHDKWIIGAIERKRAHRPRELFGLAVADAPIVGALPVVRDLPDGGPVVFIEDGGDESGGDLARLIRGGGVVGARGYLDRHHGGAARLIDVIHRYHVAAHAHGDDPRIVGHRRDRAVSGPGDGNRPRGVDPIRKNRK